MDSTAPKSVSRDKLLEAIQAYAEEWKQGKSIGISHPARTALLIELDRYEFEVIENTLVIIVKYVRWYDK